MARQKILHTTSWLVDPLIAWYAIPLSRAIRTRMGGCDAKMSPSSPSFADSRLAAGSTMQRCAAPRVIALVGAEAAYSF